MAHQIVVPELSESVVEATVAEWFKQVGDQVESGETLLMLETDKVSLEVTAEASGVLTEIKAQEGDDVAPGDLLAILDESDSASAGAAAEPATSSAPQPEVETSQSAEETTQTANGQRVTPVAQRYAAEHDVDLSKVSPADGEKITRSDVERYLSAEPQPAAPAQSTPPKQPQAPASQPSKSQSALLRAETQPSQPYNGYRREERARMSRRRQTIARRMVEAQSEAAMLTTFNEIDMGAVMDLRKRRKEAFKEKHGISLGLSSFFVKASISALKAFPRLNAEIQGREIVTKYYYDIGIAIGAEEGLVVPVLRDADRMSFAEIESQIREYARQSQEGTLSLEALTGGTFSITNGGVFGSMLSTPIINPPQVAILGLHSIKDRPAVVDGEVMVRPMMYVALTYDHRIVDGREAVQFLVHVKDLVEDPESLLIEG